MGLETLAINKSMITYAIGIFALSTLAYWFAQKILKDDLRHVPGPFLSKWTSLGLKIQTLRGNKAYHVHQLHQQYGPLVRLAPGEVSIGDVAAAKTIYRVASPFLKSRWYQRFAGFGKVGVPESSSFTMIDPKLHAHHRRNQAFNFSDKWIKVLEPQVQRNVKMAMAGMSSEAEQTNHFDAFKWMTFMATDAIGEAAFGESFKLLESGKKNTYTDDLELVGRRGVYNAELPGVLDLLARLPIGMGADYKRALLRMAEYGSQSVNRYWTQWKSNKDQIKPTLLTNEYRLVEDGVITETQLKRDAMGYIVAGTDTTAVTATYIVWALAQHPEIQSQVISEVAKLPADLEDDDLKHVELFNNVINETLRMYGPANSSLPRVVPKEGATFCGHFIPGGTTISTQAFTLHRDPHVWSDPLRFDPSRWSSPSKEMKESFMPFGGGSRICLGMHFALLELRHAIVQFYRTFPNGVEPAFTDGFTAEGMEQSSWFLMAPQAKRCLVRPL